MEQNEKISLRIKLRELQNKKSSSERQQNLFQETTSSTANNMTSNSVVRFAASNSQTDLNNRFNKSIKTAAAEI